MRTAVDTVAFQSSGYRYEATLSSKEPHRTHLCNDERGHPVVLKQLETDCLYRDQLHPAIRDRLERIRELPHPRLATLCGVARIAGDAYLIWNYVRGNAWGHNPLGADAWLAQAGMLISVVETMHRRGLVHGNLHAGNVIVTADNDVWLTDVSPYLYTDPIVDIEAVALLLRESIEHGDEYEIIRTVLERFDSQSSTLRQLANSLAAGREALPVEERAPDHHWRWKPVAAAVVLTLACIALFILLRVVLTKLMLQ